MKADNRTILTDLLQERVTPWNGMLYTRAEIVRELTRKGFTKRSIDFWAFHRPALTESQINAMYEQGQLYNNVPDIFPDWLENARWDPEYFG